MLITENIKLPEKYKERKKKSPMISLYHWLRIPSSCDGKMRACFFL
jgi:hypothetical protein